MRNSLLDKVQLSDTGTERLLSMPLNTSDGPLNLLCVYAPNLTAPDDIKDSFYNQLETTMKGYQKQEVLIILKD